MYIPYTPAHSFDEMITPDGNCRGHYQTFNQMLNGISGTKLKEMQNATDRAQLAMGMTFNVYHDDEGQEKILHLDVIPRSINGKE